ncbi:MAG: cell division protein ZapA [Hyphomonas sp.]
MAKADIELRGRTFSIACAPGQEERVNALAGQLDTRLRSIVDAVGDIGDERLLLVAALALLDELDDMRKKDPISVQTEQRCAAAITDAAARIDAIVNRIEGGQ